jgi:uncharacterized membrane protein
MNWNHVRSGLALGAVLAGAVFVPAGPARAAGCSWQVSALPSLVPGGFAEVLGADPSGVFWSGLSRGADDHGHAVIWRNGQVTDLGTSAAGEARAMDVNRQGVVVGDRLEPSGFATPTMWRNGQVVALALPPQALGGFAMGINDAGQIVGEIDFDGSAHAATWLVRSPGRVVDLGDAGGGFASLSAVTETGVLAGATTIGENQVAITGTVSQGLRELPATGPSLSTSAAGAAGQYVVGREQPGVGSTSSTGGAIRWTNGRAELLSTALDDVALAVNTSGLVAGFNDRGALVWQNGVKTHLPGLDDSIPAVATTINEAGQIGGWSARTSSDVPASIWACV